MFKYYSDFLKGLTSWFSFVMSNCSVLLSHAGRYLIVSIPDICLLSYFNNRNQFLTKNKVVDIIKF